MTMNMDSKSIYDVPEVEVIAVTFERNLLEGSGIDPGGNVDDPINDGND